MARNLTALELLEGLRSGSIDIWDGDQPLPINYSPEVTISHDPEAWDARWASMTLRFCRDDVLLFFLVVSGYAFFKGDGLDYADRPLCVEYPEGVDEAVPRVVPNADGTMVLLFDGHSDNDPDFARCRLPAGCGPAELPGVCAELQAFLRKAMPGFETPSESGAFRWMVEHGFSQVVYDRFCSLTAATLLGGLRDGSIVIENDPASFPIEYGEATIESAEPSFSTMSIWFKGELLFEIGVRGWGFWRAGDGPDDDGELYLGFNSGDKQHGPQVVAGDSDDMVFVYGGNNKAMPKDRLLLQNPLQLPAGCPPADVETLCAELQSALEQARPGFDGRSDADELEWVSTEGFGTYIGVGENGEVIVDAFGDGVQVECVSLWSHGRWVFGVEGVDRLFLCPKEAGETAKSLLISRLQQSIERIAATEVVVPKMR